ncbi:MAG: ATP synthase F1 subunit epsilon [Candidatus Sumerlaeia bacterium]|nr:ATP synthase F1 subunit epsilon [Candidatus Sumerlaeia bacterium]
MPDFRLQIVTAERMVFDEDVTSIIAPGTVGYLGVLAHHAPLLTTLEPGRLTVRRGDHVRQYRISAGFLEVRNNVATILCDSLESV